MLQKGELRPAIPLPPPMHGISPRNAAETAGGLQEASHCRAPPT